MNLVSLQAVTPVEESLDPFEDDTSRGRLAHVHCVGDEALGGVVSVYVCMYVCMYMTALGKGGKGKVGRGIGVRVGGLPCRFWSAVVEREEGVFDGEDFVVCALFFGFLVNVGGRGRGIYVYEE